jgi:hypothetical protein
MANQKFKFGAQPKDFKRTITLHTVDDKALDLEVTYQYRTKKEFAELADEGIKRAKADFEASRGDDNSSIESMSDSFWSELYEKSGKNSAEHVLKIAKGWDIEDDLSKENLMRLENEFPGSLKAISSTYANAVAEERIKN